MKDIHPDVKLLIIQELIETGKITAAQALEVILHPEKQLDDDFKRELEKLINDYMWR